MEEKLKQAALRLQEVELLLAQPEVYADTARLRALTREQKELTPVVAAFGDLEAARAMQSEAELMLADPELRELAREELRQAKEAAGGAFAGAEAAAFAQVIRTTTAAWCWSFAPAWAARKERFLPRICCGCTCSMPTNAAGRRTWCPAATRSWAASRRLFSPWKVPAFMPA